MLAGYGVVVLGEMPLSAAQATMFSDFVTAGGNLIAMHPDPDLAGLLGITSAGIDVVGRLPAGEHRDASRAAASPARRSSSTAPPTATRSAARRRSRRCTATQRPRPPNPAVTLRGVGASGGQAAAFTYDLARSVVETRQGNPAWAGQERDATTADPLR